MVSAIEPGAEILRGHPTPPSDLEPLVEIELIDRKHDVGGGEDAEKGELGHEGIPVAVLQRVVEAQAPLVEEHRDVYGQ